MHIYKCIISIMLVICIIFCPLCIKVKADLVISSFVIGAFLAVAISLGFYFNVNNTDISAWVQAKINAYLQANGYNSIEAWLGANFQAEASFSGSYLSLTPSLYAKLKLAVEFAIGSGNDQLPSGGTVSDPVMRTIEGGFYFPSIEYNGTTYTDFPIMDLRPLLASSEAVSGTVGGTVEFHIIPDLPYGWYLPVPTATATQNLSFTFSNKTITGYNEIYYSTASSVATYKRYNIVMWGFGGEKNSNGVFTWPSSIMPVNNASWGQLNYDDRVSPVITFGVIDNTPKAVPVLAWKAINGNYYVSYQKTPSQYWSWFIPYGGTTQIDAYSVGLPAYTFNNADLIYIDLQLGQINSTLQAIMDLITAINNNLISWTLAIQSNTPSDLPENTTPLIDYVDYCNEQTNLYLSGTSSISACVGNMYQELYSVLNEVTSSQISTACINTYNAFINKLTLYASLSSTGGSLSSVQAFQDALYLLTGTYDQKIANATSLLDTYISNASGLSEIIGLYNAFTAYCDSLGFQINLITDTKTSISDMNTVVDNYIAGTISSEQALSSLLTLYKTGLNGSKTADQVGAIVSAYQACVDRVTLLGLEIDPDGLGDVSADVINLEDDLLSNIDLNEISSLLAFQNWTYINTSEGSLYREFFQKIMDSSSPFYLFIYVPLILGIVSIILGTRMHLPSKKSSGSHSDSSIFNDDSWDF